GPEAAREKSLWRDHPFTAHLWWARRPLIASRAAVFGSIVRADAFAPEAAPESKTRSLGRANATKFFDRLCKHPLPSSLAAEARRLVRSSYDSLAGDTKSDGAPRLLDMFAGGGAIPFEAVRLGFETFATDLNPVAYIIQLCTCSFPQQYGLKHSEEQGCAKGTWAGLSEEVAHWGRWVRARCWKALAEFYPEPTGAGIEEQHRLGEISPGTASIIPIGWMWTRAVTCKNPACRVEVPLIRQSWLYRRSSECAAVKLSISTDGKLKSEIFAARDEAAMPFDPSDLSRARNAACLRCGTVADIDYVKEQGWAGKIFYRLITVVCRRPQGSGRLYLAPSKRDPLVPNEEQLGNRLWELCEASGLTIPTESIAALPETSRENTLGITVRPYGITSWNKLFLDRQLLCLLQFAHEIRLAYVEMVNQGYGIRPAG
ncbi:MAG: hypothetical protein DME33_15690, partial [Verrucomicrobia bacterium]